MIVKKIVKGILVGGGILLLIWILIMFAFPGGPDNSPTAGEWFNRKDTRVITRQLTADWTYAKFGKGRYFHIQMKEGTTGRLILRVNGRDYQVYWIDQRGYIEDQQKRCVRDVGTVDYIEIRAADATSVGQEYEVHLSQSTKTRNTGPALCDPDNGNFPTQDMGTPTPTPTPDPAASPSPSPSATPTPTTPAVNANTNANTSA